MGASQTDPVREPRRLAAVVATELLDTAPEAAFDDLTRMAALLVDAPFAFATVVDDARSFWKSCFGLPLDAPRQNTVEESFCQYVVRSERELLITDATTDPRTRDNPSVASMGVRAWAGFPLFSPTGEVLGSFCVVDTEPRAWSARDIEILRTLSAAASREVALRAAVQNERTARLRAETLAHTLQESLLPPVLPEVPGLDVAVRFRPAGSGIDLVGDFYDLFASRDDAWSFVVGDVCGKGVEAAKVAALARHTIGAAAMRHGDTCDVLTWLNETMLARSPAPGTFLTALYGTIAARADGAWLVRFASAGHPPPIVRRRDGTTQPIAAHGPLVGVFPDFATVEVAITLAPGDAFVVYTDGITESRVDGVLYGEEALVALIAGAPTDAAPLARRIEDAALAFGCTENSYDDMAVLVIRVPDA